MRAAGDLTDLLLSWRSGDGVGDRLELEREIYSALRRMAGARWREAGTPQTLNPTALVNEAVARLLGGEVDWTSRTHFFALAALQMRAVLVDHARRRGAQKRGAGVVHLSLNGEESEPTQESDILDLDAALFELSKEDPRSAEIVVLTYFGGLTARECSAHLGLSDSTVESDLAYGRAWLKTRLAP